MSKSKNVVLSATLISDKSKADWDRIINTSEVGCIDEAELERLTAPVEDSMPAIYWKELGAVLAAYGAMGLFVAACIWTTMP